MNDQSESCINDRHKSQLTGDLSPITEDLALPLVSVIIPCYQQAHFLGEAIESVLNQTYRHFEIIVVDDGSTDNTPEVAVRYSIVRYSKQENQGLAGARNTGIRESRGDYLVFLDADDRLLPIALETGLNCLNEHPKCAFAFGRHRRIDLDGSIQKRSAVLQINHNYYSTLLRGNCIGMHATVIYRRDALEAVGGFDVSLPACEDYDLYLRIARSFPVCHHNEEVAEYRWHGTNMSLNVPLMLKTVLTVLRSQRQHVRADARYRQAYRAGITAWQGYYGKQLAGYIQAKGDVIQAARMALLLLRYAPQLVVREMVKQILRKLRRQLTYRPAVGRVHFGDLGSVVPISRVFGYDRGLPIDRYYIEAFLSQYASDIQGRVLEIGDNSYTRRYGGSRVSKSDVLHVTEGNPQATFIGDLTQADHIPSNAFDCIVLTQTLHLVYEVRAALRTLYRILKPGGVLLLTVPGVISQIEQGQWGNNWYWGFTDQAAQRLFEEVFPSSEVTVESYGNVLAAVAFLQGLAVTDVQPVDLDYRDPLYQLLITVKAIKPVTP